MAWYRTAAQSITFPSINGQTYMSVLNTALAAICGDANFGWQLATYQSASAPYYIILKRKDGSAGRIYICNGGSPASGTAYYSPGAGAGSHTPVWGYDFTATADTASQSTNVGPPFGGTQGLNWRSTMSNASARTVEMRGYWNAAENVVAFVMTSVSSNVDSIFMVGNFLRDETGVVRQGILSNGQSAMTAAWPAIGNTASVDYSSTSTVACNAFAYDPSVNSNAGGSVLLMQLNNLTVMNRGSYTGDTNHYTTTGGLHIFHPVTFIPTQTNFPYGFQSRAYASRFIGYGPPKTKDFEWLDNASASQGYYLGYTATAGADRCGISLLNYDF